MLESPLFDLTLELIIGFFALFIITRFIRKSQINAVTPFDFISSVVLGELVGNAIYDDEIKILSILYAVFVWGFLMFIIEKLTQRIRRTRKFFDGDPAIIIRDGQIDFNVIKREELDINELLSILRQKEVFSIREVEYGIIEPSGSISILKKQKYSAPTLEDLNIEPKPVYLPISLILDGEVIEDNLKVIGFEEEWLIKEVRKHGVKQIKDVFYAEWKQDIGIHVIPRKIDNKNKKTK